MVSGATRCPLAAGTLTRSDPFPLMAFSCWWKMLPVTRWDYISIFRQRSDSPRANYCVFYLLSFLCTLLYIFVLLKFPRWTFPHKCLSPASAAAVLSWTLLSPSPPVWTCGSAGRPEAGRWRFDFSKSPPGSQAFLSLCFAPCFGGKHPPEIPGETADLGAPIPGETPWTPRKVLTLPFLWSAAWLGLGRGAESPLHEI